MTILVLKRLEAEPIPKPHDVVSDPSPKPKPKVPAPYDDSNPPKTIPNPSAKLGCIKISIVE